MLRGRLLPDGPRRRPGPRPGSGVAPVPSIWQEYAHPVLRSGTMQPVLIAYDEPGDFRDLLAARFPDVEFVYATTAQNILEALARHDPEVVFSIKHPGLPGPAHGRLDPPLRHAVRGQPRPLACRRAADAPGRALSASRAPRRRFAAAGRAAPGGGQGGGSGVMHRMRFRRAARGPNGPPARRAPGSPACRWWWLRAPTAHRAPRP